MSKWTQFIVLEGSVNPISTLIVNAPVNFSGFTTRELQTAAADRHTSKKRQMRISNDSYVAKSSPRYMGLHPRTYKRLPRYDKCFEHLPWDCNWGSHWWNNQLVDLQQTKENH
jgi:hypothetical protein